MRMHIELADEMTAEIDRVAGARGRSTFIRAAVERALAEVRRRESLRSAAGAISDTGHEWDGDAAEWVHLQRRADGRRAG